VFADHRTLPRTADAPALAAALRATRQRTLGLIDAWRRARPGLQVPPLATLNPPLWELGHVGWFQEWWIARNAQRHLGTACEPDHRRPASRLGRADLLYDSSNVAHADRWRLPLPDLDATLGYLLSLIHI
jgi:iron(II)-dependent oxidoreductase